MQDTRADPNYDLGANTGRVAVARAILKTIYAMLTKQEAFRPMAKGTTGQRHGVMAR